MLTDFILRLFGVSDSTAVLGGWGLAMSVNHRGCGQHCAGSQFETLACNSL